MFQRFRLFALLLCLLLLLTACGGSPTGEKEASPAARHSAGDSRTLPVETPAPTAAPAETPAPTAAPAETPAPEAVDVQVHYGETTEIEHVEFTGVSADGRELWKRIFTTDYRTELKLIQPIGLWSDRYYLNNSGTVVCLRLSDGATLWENAEFGGASISSLIDGGSGSVYLCGWYGPDFFACDCWGKTLANIPSASDYYFWPSDMERSGEQELTLYYYGSHDGGADDGHPYTVDLRDFSVTVEADTVPVTDVQLELSADEQYWANVFVSDFAEQGIGWLEPGSASTLQLADFAHMFCKINRHDAIVYVDGCETVSLDTVNELCARFFNLTLAPSDGVLYTNDWGMEWKYENGLFYFPASDGEAYNNFAVVRELWEQPGGMRRLVFDVYELNLDEYFTSGMDGALYSLDAGSAASLAAGGRISLLGSGTAYAWRVTQGGHDGYWLVRYEFPA